MSGSSARIRRSGRSSGRCACSSWPPNPADGNRARRRIARREPGAVHGHPHAANAGSVGLRPTPRRRQLRGRRRTDPARGAPQCRVTDPSPRPAVPRRAGRHHRRVVLSRRSTRPRMGNLCSDGAQQAGGAPRQLARPAHPACRVGRRCGSRGPRRRDGAAIVHAGVEADTTAVAVPIRSNGDIVGAINVVGPSFRMNRSVQHDIAAAAAAAATALQLAVKVR